MWSMSATELGGGSAAAFEMQSPSKIALATHREAGAEACGGISESAVRVAGPSTV
jgi:hypothetical protein